MMRRVATDRRILECIYDLYHASYPGRPAAGGRPENDPYLAIDLQAVADRAGCRPELLYGRLYYHLDQEYRYEQHDGARVHLFHLKFGDRRHLVHFPYLVSILARQQEEHRRFWWPLIVSAAALAISALAAGVSFLK